MPGFQLSGHADAPVEAVWKLLFDPGRFPEWWAGVGAVESTTDDVYTMWPEGYPNFPMPQRMRTDRAGGRVTISCQVSDIDVAWQLAERGAGTAIEVRVDLPESAAFRLDGQRAAMKESLARLTALAEASA